MSEVGNIVIDWYNRAYPIKDLNQVDKTKDLKKILDFAERQLPNLKVVFETITPEAIDEIVDLQFYVQSTG